LRKRFLERTRGDIEAMQIELFDRSEERTSRLCKKYITSQWMALIPCVLKAIIEIGLRTHKFACTYLIFLRDHCFAVRVVALIFVAVRFF